MSIVPGGRLANSEGTARSGWLFSNHVPELNRQLRGDNTPAQSEFESELTEFHSQVLPVATSSTVRHCEV